MKKTIESYDKIEHGQSSYPQHQISLEDIKIPTAPPACLVLAVNVQVRVMSHAFALKRESIDLQIMTRRCVEEKALVEDDIKNYISRTPAKSWQILAKLIIVLLL